MPEQDRGLITVRMENIFTWGEFAKVDRGAEENEDLDEAADAAESIDTFQRDAGWQDRCLAPAL